MKKEFEIDFEIYSEEKIKQAIGDFIEIAIIDIKNNLLIISGDSDREINEIFNELMNYVISLES